MIYKTEIENFHLLESYKERNLYYKILGGYLLNEMIPGYEKRKGKLINLFGGELGEQRWRYDPALNIEKITSCLISEKWNVTFDYHLAQIFADDKL